MIVIEPPVRRPFSEYVPEARQVCGAADPPVSFREALSVYRQLRFGFLFFRNTFTNEEPIR